MAFRFNRTYNGPLCLTPLAWALRSYELVVEPFIKNLINIFFNNYILKKYYKNNVYHAYINFLKYFDYLYF